MAKTKPPQKNLITGMLHALFWLDDGLQNFLKSLGWPTLSRTQSMIMMNVISGTNKASVIARNLGISRQAIHLTLTQMIEQGILKMEEDPNDRRSKIIVLTDAVEPMRQDARRATTALEKILAERFSKEEVAVLKKVVGADWGGPIIFEKGKKVSENSTGTIQRRRSVSKKEKWQKNS